MKNLYLAPMVIGHRMINLAMMSVDPSPQRVKEAMRMSSEKAVATWAGLAGAQMAAMRGSTAFWSDIMAGRTPLRGLRGTLDSMHKAGVAPANRTLRANAKRLSKRKAI